MACGLLWPWDKNYYSKSYNKFWLSVHFCWGVIFLLLLISVHGLLRWLLRNKLINKGNSVEDFKCLVLLYEIKRNESVSMIIYVITKYFLVKFMFISRNTKIKIFYNCSVGTHNENICKNTALSWKNRNCKYRIQSFTETWVT